MMTDQPQFASQQQLQQVLGDPERTALLEETGLINEKANEVFQRIARLAREWLEVDTSFVTLVEADGQWFKATEDQRQTLPAGQKVGLEFSLCQHAVANRSPLQIDDLRDSPQLASNDALAELEIGAYLGIPLIVEDQPLGAFCVASHTPRNWTSEERRQMEELSFLAAREIENQLEVVRHQASERKASNLADIVRAAPDLIGTARMDGEVLFINPAGRKLVGLEQKDRRKYHFQELHPEEVVETLEQEAIPQAIEEGNWQGETVLLTAENERLPVSQVVIAHKDQEGELNFISTIVRDISNQKAAERRLETLARAVREAPSSILIADVEPGEVEAELLWANPEFESLTGYRVEEMQGQGIRSLFVGLETEVGKINEFQQAIREGHLFQDVLRLYRHNDEVRIIDVRMTPLTNEQGQTTRIVIAAADITAQEERKRWLEEEVQKRTQKLEKARREVLQRLARAAEYRDDETGQHTRRVGQMSRRIAAELGWSTEKLKLLEETAPLHDLGKIGIPDVILLKPGALSKYEWEIMKEHTTIGADLLAGGESQLAQMAESIARTHHERWDGQGYPRGLKGAHIPMAGRIVAVVDAFDALTHDRPYKEAWPVEKAVEEIVSGKAERYDPTIVEAFIERLDELAELLET